MTGSQKLVYFLIGLVSLIALLIGYFQNSLQVMVIAVYVLAFAVWVKEVW